MEIMKERHYVRKKRKLGLKRKNKYCKKKGRRKARIESREKQKNFLKKQKKEKVRMKERKGM